MAAKVGVVVVLSRRNKLIVSGCYESYFFYPFLPAATYLFLPVSTRGSRQNETLTNKMRVDLPTGKKKRFPQCQYFLVYTTQIKMHQQTLTLLFFLPSPLSPFLPSLSL